MKKKIFSLFLAVVIVVSMVTVAMVSTSANVDESGLNGKYSKAIHFDVNSAKWGAGVKAVYCHIYNYSGTDGKEYTQWQTKGERCEYDKETGIATYYLQTGIDKGADGLSTIDSSNKWVIMFSANTGADTYTLLFNSNCFGDTVIADPNTKFEHTIDPEKLSIKISYKNNTNLTAPKCITSTGKIQGESFAEGVTNETLLGDYMAMYAAEDWRVNKDIISKLSNELGVKPSSVLDYVKDKIYDDDINYPYSHNKKDAIKRIEKVIIEVEGGEVRVDIPAITNLQNTADGIRISWDEVSGAYGYRLYYKYPGKDWKRFKDTTATSFTDTGVSAGRTETYTIRCIDKDGNTISGYNSSGWSKKYEPITPTITKLENTSDGIKISWNKIAGVYGYRLYYKYPGKDWKRFKDTTTTSFTDTGVSIGRTETYTIRCIDKNGNTVSGYNSGGWSQTYSLPRSIPHVTKLENTSNGIKISWNKVEGVYGYRLYYKYPGKDWKRFKDTTATSFTDTGVSAGRTETYTIRCIDSNGNTFSGYNSDGWSKKYEPVAPTITKLEKTSNGVKISWNPVAGVYGYRLYYKYPGQDWKRFKDTTGTSFTDTGVKSGRTETYTIRCIDKNGNTISGYNPNGWSITY